MQSTNLIQEEILLELLLTRKKYQELEEKALKLEEEVKLMENLQKQFDSLFANSSEGILIIQDHEVKAANPEVYKIMRSETNVIGNKIRAFADAEFSPDGVETYDRIVSGESISFFKGEETLLNSDGLEIPVEVHGGSFSYLGKPAVLVLFRDLTYIQKAEEELLALRQYKESIVESASIWLEVLDNLGNVVVWNKAAEDISGYLKDEVIGGNGIQKWIYPDDEYRRNIHSEVLEILESESSVSEYETTIRRKDGETRIMSWNSKRICDINNNQIGYISLGRDITSRKIAEDELQKSYSRVKDILGGTINAMGAVVESRDPYTAGHQHRVAELSVAIAKKMELSPSQIDVIRMAAYVHDIGKIAVPAEILTKPTQLSKAEFEIIKSHPTVSYEILKDIEFEYPIATIVFQHHEKLDGSGYPAGISGDEILLEARIITVADIVEAMSSHRPYRPALDMEVALDEIASGSDTLYDRDVVEACIRLIEDDGYSF